MKLSLNSQIAVGAALGVILGAVLGHTAFFPAPTNASLLSAFDFLGKVFIQLLKLVLVPLVFTSITAGIANLKNYPHSQRVWPVLLLYSLTTTGLAAVTGLTVMNLVQPGVGLDLHVFKENMNAPQFHPMSVNDFLHKLVESVLMHPLSALAQSNILTVVIFAVLTAIVIIVSGEAGRPVLRAINTLFEIMMKLVRWIMALAPIGIMGLLTVLIARQNVQLLYVLSKYIIVVSAVTVFHGTVTLPLILWLAAKISPVKFFSGMKQAFITAFSTSSSTATLPVSLRCITDNLHIKEDIARFVLPVGAALNMDGTAMYEAMAALFVANLCGAHLTLAAQVTVVLTAMTASIGAPGIPSAGMVTMIMVLQSVGLPVQAVGLLIAIDRPLDTVRTVVNVEGDCVGACVVQRFAGD